MDLKIKKIKLNKKKNQCNDNLYFYYRVEEIQKLILNVVIPKINQLNVAIIWWYSNFLI
jgi:hypothetical protein